MRNNTLLIAILLSFICLSFIFHSSKEIKSTAGHSKSVVALQATVIKEGYIRLPKQKKDTLQDSTKVYYLNTVLTNNSAETIYFVSMSCSHEDMYVVKEPSLFQIQFSQDCEKNYTTLISLKPKETYSKEIVIRPRVEEGLLPKSTIIGFEFVEFIKGKEFDIIERFQSRHSTGNTILSNNFDLKVKK